MSTLHSSSSSLSNMRLFSQASTLENYFKAVHRRKSILDVRKALSSFQPHEDTIAEISKTRNLRGPEVDGYISELVECCLTHVYDSYQVHLNRLKGLEVLKILIDRAPLHKITSETVMHMLWASISCIHHFVLKVRPHETGILQYIRRKQAKRATATYDKLVEFLSPLYYSILFSSLLTFFSEANLWGLEFFCATLLTELLWHGTESQRNDSLVDLITLNQEDVIENTITARQILDILYLIQTGCKWKWMNSFLIKHLLNSFYQIISKAGRDVNNEFHYQSSVQHIKTMIDFLALPDLMVMIKWMLTKLTLEEINDDYLFTYGMLLESITNIYTRLAIDKSLSSDLIPLILKVIPSHNLKYSLLGNRILQNLLDRNDNKTILQKPKIFFRNSITKITINKYDEKDKVLWQKYRQAFHQIFLQSILRHGQNSVYLENIYTTIALFLVEIPCSYLAASAVCIAMSIQEVTLKAKSISIVHAHRIHATIGSILSLVCFIYKATEFYNYVEEIIVKRAKYAPQLNPPFRFKYKYAQHHILWNKTDLFFEDWETRYGLWKCFKNKHKDLILKSKDVKTPT